MRTVEQVIHGIQEQTRAQSRGTLAVAGAGDGDNGRVRRRISFARQALSRSGLAVPREHERLVGEQFRTIKRPLIGNAFGKNAEQVPRGNLLMVTSALAGEGKTFCCCNLALSMAREKDRPVILIDADVLKPRLTQSVNAASEAGLLDLLADDACTLADVLMGTDVDRLFFLPCGRARANAHELLASRRMDALLADMANNFDGMVLFDSPPLLETSEARVVAELVGQVLLVVAAAKTPQARVLDAVGLIDDEKALNVMLNRASGKADDLNYLGAYGKQ